jgi:hypothetical protein
MSLALVPALRLRGFTVRSASEADMRGARDEQQLEYATHHDLVLFIRNIRHFRRLHDRFSMVLDGLGLVGGCQSRFFTWGHVQFLLTQGLRLPGYTDADHRFALGQGDERTPRR